MPLNKTVKLESLLKILRLLNKGAVLTPAQLAESLEVTERTVYRYIMALQRAGYPIFFDKQKNSYRFMDGYTLTEHSSNNELYQALSLKSRMTDSLAVGLISYDHLGQCVVVNEAAALILGGSREMLLKANYHNLEPWKISGLAVTAKSVMEKGAESHGEYHLTTTYGKEIWVYCSISRFMQKGNPFLMIVFQDISLLKSTEIRLRDAEKLMQQFLEYTPIYTFIKDDQFRPVMLSRNYEQLFEMPLENIIGKRMNELLPEEIARRVVQEDQKVLDSNEVFQEDDEINGRYYSTTKFAIQHESSKSLGGFMIEVTERKLIEKRVNALEEQFRVLADATMDAVCIFDERGTILDVNEQACALYGYSREELLGINRVDFEVEVSHEDFSERINIVKGSGSYRYTTKQTRKDGNMFDAEVRAAYMPETRKLLELTRLVKS